MKIGEKIKYFREFYGFGVRSLAEKANISNSYLSELENGKNKSSPSNDILEKIAVALNLNDEEKYNLLYLSALERTPDLIKEEFEKLKKENEKYEDLEKERKSEVFSQEQIKEIERIVEEKTNKFDVEKFVKLLVKKLEKPMESYKD